MEANTVAIGELVSKVCATCGEEQSHKVSTLTKKGLVSKVICSVCSTVSTFKNAAQTELNNGEPKTGTPYDRTQTYRKGQKIMHSKFGYGEVMSIIEAQKMDVKFADGLRRMIHSQS